MTQQTEIAAIYRDWLSSKSPDESGTLRNVTRKETRRHFDLVVQRAGQQPGIDAFMKHWARGGATWFWSDLHLGHERIIGYCDRPFPNAAGMDNAMLENALRIDWPREAWLVIVGDISFTDDSHTRNWLAQIPARKLLILGNHDVQHLGRGLPALNPLRWGLDAVALCLELPVRAARAHGDKSPGVRRYWLTHYPIEAARLPRDVLNLHGHMHNRPFGPAHTHINLSVECIGYTPIQIDGAY